MEGNENIPNGWPLGLGNINSRITVVAPPQPAHRRCSSFSSFSSSNLDTESSASFFPDQSVPLGRLIGIRAAAANKVQMSEKEGVNVGVEEGVGGPTPTPTPSPQCEALQILREFVLRCCTM